MANLLDDLDWRGDLILRQSPVNEVDNLILAELSFIDFSGIVPAPGEGPRVPLWQAAQRWQAGNRGELVNMGVLVPNRIPEMLRRMAETPRFRDMELCGYREHLDTERAEQFAALTILCGDGTAYFSFRGTDDTLAGWKEDFYLSCMAEVPAQKKAVAYTKEMARLCPRLKLRLGFLYNPDYRFIGRQALHSYTVAFRHPITGEAMEFTAPMPEDFSFFY